MEALRLPNTTLTRAGDDVLIVHRNGQEIRIPQTQLDRWAVAQFRKMIFPAVLQRQG